MIINILNKQNSLLCAKRKDIIIFICDKCNYTCSEQYGKKEKFHQEKIYCGNCLKSINNAFNRPDIKEKIKQTNISRYGVSNPSQSLKIKKKKEETCFKNYGVKNPSQSLEIKNKKEKTCLNNYGVKQILSIKQLKEKSMLNKYGIAYAKQLPLFLEKCKNTCKSRYNVEFPAQHNKFHLKAMSSFGRSQKIKTIHENLHYQNNSELKCIEYCQFNNIRIVDGPSIEYFWDNSIHIYHIDFETDKHLLEIKSNHHWYKQDLKSGKIEAKNNAAIAYAKSIGKEYLFLLDIVDYSQYIITNID